MPHTYLASCCDVLFVAHYAGLPVATTSRPSGQTRLSQAQASARLSEAQLLSFNVEMVPAEGHRQAGYVRAGGVVPLADAATAGSGGKGSEQQMDVRLNVKDGGMALLTSITPDLRWQGGLAAIDVRLRGTVEQPVLSGSASISRATLDCPLLRFPLTNASAEVRAGGGMLTVESLEARCGRRGHIRARGSLPLYSGGVGGRGPPLLTPIQQMQQHVAPHRLLAEASALELRVRNLYSGQYDASLVLTNSLASPTVAGGMRFSKGIVFIVPQGAPGARTAMGQGNASIYGAKLWCSYDDCMESAPAPSAPLAIHATPACLTRAHPAYHVPALLLTYLGTWCRCCRHCFCRQ